MYFLTYYTATKSSFTLPEITISQDKTKYTAGPHTPPLAHVDVHSVIIPIPRQKIPVRTDSCPKRRGGGGVKREHCLAGEYSRLLLIRFCKKLEELKIFVAFSFCTLFAHPSSLQVAKNFPRKTNVFTAPWVSKRMALPLTLIWADRHVCHDFKQKHIKIARFNF